MEDFERIANAKNSVGADTLGIGRNNPNAMATSETSVYRITGMDQVDDIVSCGYVRPKGYGARREKVGDKVYWSLGGEKLYFYDGRPVLEAPIDKVKDGQIGAIHLDDLTGIWIFDNDNQMYVNNIEYFRNLYYQSHLEQEVKGKSR